MCGRYTLTSPLEAVADLFDVESGLNLGPRYNIAPTQDVPVLRLNQQASRELVQIRWGLIPSWAKQFPKSALINARAETVGEKPSFRSAFKSQRCLIPSDGFYEWQTTGPKGAAKTPFHIKFKTSQPMIFAGIWDHWQGPKGESIDSVAMLTTGANQDISPIHHRMPVIIANNDFETWLAAPIDELTALMQPYPDGQIEAIEVGTRVNSVRNDDPECLAPVSKTGELF